MAAHIMEQAGCLALTKETFAAHCIYFAAYVKLVVFLIGNVYHSSRRWMGFRISFVAEEKSRFFICWWCWHTHGTSQWLFNHRNRRVPVMNLCSEFIHIGVTGVPKQQVCKIVFFPVPIGPSLWLQGHLKWEQQKWWLGAGLTVVAFEGLIPGTQVSLLDFPGGSAFGHLFYQQWNLEIWRDQISFDVVKAMTSDHKEPFLLAQFVI